MTTSDGSAIIDASGCPRTEGRATGRWIASRRDDGDRRLRQSADCLAEVLNTSESGEGLLKPQIIVMLTQNDVTVSNARECFQQAADLPVQYWGFKDIGLPTNEMKGLVADFLDAGKTPVLEVVNFEGPGLLRAAALAVDCGVEYFTGGLFARSVQQLVRPSGIKYFPFCGDVGGSPVQMRGTPEAVLADAERLVSLGVDGVDLVAYRFTGGAPIALAAEVQERLGGDRLIVAGSINSRERMSLMQDINPFAYTMGGALFDGVFAPGKSFRDNLERVVVMDAAFMGNSA